MSKQMQFTLEEVAGIVKGEGLGYAVTDYLSPERIANSDLRALWEQAAEVLGKINEMLYPE